MKQLGVSEHEMEGGRELTSSALEVNYLSMAGRSRGGCVESGRGGGAGAESGR